MGMFYLHLREGSEPADGSPLNEIERLAFYDMAEARAAAVRHARDLLSLGLARGRLDLSRRFDIEDEQGHAVSSVKFVETVDLKTE